RPCGAPLLLGCVGGSRSRDHPLASLPAGGVRRVDRPGICRAECSGRVEKPAVLHDSLAKRAAVHKKRSPFHAAGGVAGSESAPGAWDVGYASPSDAAFGLIRATDPRLLHSLAP